MHEIYEALRPKIDPKTFVFVFPLIFMRRKWNMKKKMYFVTKIVLTNCEKKMFLKLLKLEAEGREFAKVLRSLEQFVQIVKG